MSRIIHFIQLLLLGSLAQTQQNTIIIIADDIGTDYFGMYEDAKDTIHMPNIRMLATKGVRFQNFYTTPYCSPSRACLLTGRFPFRHGVGTVIGGANSAQLDTSEITIASLLKNHAPIAYNTAHIGKWHLNTLSAQTIDYPRKYFGYDLFSGNFQGAINSYTNWTKVTNGVTKTITNYATTETVNDAIDFIDTVANTKPFFLWLAFNAPHSPFHKPPDSLYSLPGLNGTQQHINQNQKLYFKAMAEALDTEIGRFIRFLSQKKLIDNTNIIFLGDNGNAQGTSQNPLTANRLKGTLYEGGIHEPLIISGPMVIKPNRVSTSLVSVVDLFSTILEMNGFYKWSDFIPSANKVIDSKSILPILLNQDVTIRKWTFSELFSPTLSAANGKTIRNDTFKLIRFDTNREEFYNLKTDPLEQNNLLLQNLKITELNNYKLLCNELSGLLGTNLCSKSVSVTSLAKLGIKVYPTLFSSNVTIESNSSIDFYFTNSQGKMIHHGNSAGTKTISVSDWPLAIYFLTIRTKHGVASIKLVHH